MTSAPHWWSTVVQLHWWAINHPTPRYNAGQKREAAAEWVEYPCCVAEPQRPHGPPSLKCCRQSLELEDRQDGAAATYLTRSELVFILAPTKAECPFPRMSLQKWPFPTRSQTESLPSWVGNQLDLWTVSGHHPSHFGQERSSVWPTCACLELTFDHYCNDSTGGQTVERGSTWTKRVNR